MKPNKLFSSKGIYVSKRNFPLKFHLLHGCYCLGFDVCLFFKLILFNFILLSFFCDVDTRKENSYIKKDIKFAKMRQYIFISTITNIKSFSNKLAEWLLKN